MKPQGKNLHVCCGWILDLCKDYYYQGRAEAKSCGGLTHFKLFPAGWKELKAPNWRVFSEMGGCIAGVRPISPRLWMFKSSDVGQASRLTSNDMLSHASGLNPKTKKARLLRYIPEAKNQLDFAIRRYKFEKERPGKEAGWPRNPRMDKAMN